MLCVVHMCYFLCLYPFRKRRSPSPGRRRRSPSPPRRRRSPSPPRRRYRHLDFISRAIICILIIDHSKRFLTIEFWCFPGLLPHLLVVVLHPPDDILPLSSVATVPHLCLHRRGGCLALPQNALLQEPSGAPLGPPSAEVLLLKGDAHLHPPHLHPGTGGAPCCLLSGQAGIHDPPLQQPAALLGGPPVLRDVLKPSVHLHLTSGDSSPLHTVANPSAECPVPQSHATTRGNQDSYHSSPLQ